VREANRRCALLVATQPREKTPMRFKSEAKGWEHQEDPPKDRGKGSPGLPTLRKKKSRSKGGEATPGKKIERKNLFASMLQSSDVGGGGILRHEEAATSSRK